MADEKQTLLGRIGQSWKAFFRDIVLIVVSILIAFALDAWWQSGRDNAVKRDHLEALLDELETTHNQLRKFLEGVEESVVASKEILQLMGPSPEVIESSVLAGLFVNSVNVGIYNPKNTTLESMLTSGELSELPVSLFENLQAWTSMAFDIRIDSEHLERNREIDLLQAVKESGYPWSALHGVEFGNPESKFPKDPRTLLSNVEVESILSMRLIRASLLAAANRRAIDHLMDTIMLLKQELEETTN